MSNDLLPESVNLFLDDFETSLCLPILMIMVLCTVQFVFNHIFDIGYMIYQSVKKPTVEEEGERGNETATATMGKLKGILRMLGIGKADATSSIKDPPSAIDGQSGEEEWDYCDEY